MALRLELLCRYARPRPRLGVLVCNRGLYVEQAEALARLGATQPAFLIGFDKLPQFIVGARGVVGESRLRSQKVVDAVTVIGALVKWQILKHRAKPDRASPKIFDVG